MSSETCSYILECNEIVIVVVVVVVVIVVVVVLVVVILVVVVVIIIVVVIVIVIVIVVVVVVRYIEWRKRTCHDQQYLLIHIAVLKLISILSPS